MEIGEKIRVRREALGMSQSDLARAVGISQATLHKIEAGQTVRSRYLPNIAARLGIPLTDLDPSLATRLPTRLFRPRGSETAAHRAGPEKFAPMHLGDVAKYA